MITFQRRYLLLLCFCLICAISFGQTTDKTCKVEIYLLKNPILASDSKGYFSPTKAELADTPLVSDREILRYEITKDSFPSYSLVASISIRDRLQKFYKYTPLAGLPFAIVVNGEPVYGGYFWNPVSSFSCGWITATVGGNQLGIGTGVPKYCFSISHPDPRQNSVLMDCLKRTNRLKYY